MMLHEALNLTRNLIVPDCETTGVDVKNDRIIELAFQLWTPHGLEKSYRTLINPGVPIPAAATAVHGITDDMVQGCRCGRPHADHGECLAPGSMGVHHDDKDEGSCLVCGMASHTFRGWPLFAQLAPSLALGFCDCDYGGKNVRFDLRIFEAEMGRAGVEWQYTDARVIDAERLEQLGEPRTLSDLYRKHTGKELAGAHGAMADVEASAAVIVAQLDRYAVLPRAVDRLHELQWPGWIDNGGSFRMIEGVATCCFGKHRGKPMHTIPNDYWDFILKPTSDFPKDVRALASAAKLGRYPGER